MAIKNVLSSTEEGDAATKGYADSKSAGESDLDMRGHLTLSLPTGQYVPKIFSKLPLG